MSEQIVIRAVLVDMDGVVAGTQEAVTAFWQDAVAAQRSC